MSRNETMQSSALWRNIGEVAVQAGILTVPCIRMPICGQISASSPAGTP